MIRALISVALVLLVLGGSAFAQTEIDVPETVVDAAVETAAGTVSSLRTDLIPIIGLVTILSLAPGILMMMTCMPFMVIVFSFLRQAIGLQTSPPNMMITSLAMFLTFFVMEPVFVEAWTNGIVPLRDGQIAEAEAFTRSMAPFRLFMESRVHDTTLIALSEALPNRWDEAALESPPLSLLIPSFMLSEIKTAFQIGFAVFLPFLAIDLVVAAVLMAMGMMMVPPIVVSLPFKLAFFVMADGWTKIAAALLRGYSG